MKKLIVTMLTATALTISASQSLAHDLAGACGELPMLGKGLEHRMMPAKRGLFALFDSEMKITRLAQHLDLSNEQRTMVRQVLDNARPQARLIIDGLAENRRDLRALMQKDEFITESISRLANEQGALMAKLIVLRTNIWAQIKAALNDEQIEKLNYRLHKGSGHRKHL